MRTLVFTALVWLGTAAVAQEAAPRSILFGGTLPTGAYTLPLAEWRVGTVFLSQALQRSGYRDCVGPVELRIWPRLESSDMKAISRVVMPPGRNSTWRFLDAFPGVNFYEVSRPGERFVLVVALGKDGFYIACQVR